MQRRSPAPKDLERVPLLSSAVGQERWRAFYRGFHGLQVRCVIAGSDHHLKRARSPLEFRFTCQLRGNLCHEAGTGGAS